MTTLLQYPGKYFFYHIQNYYVVDSVGMFIATIWHHTFSKSLEGYSISSQSSGLWATVILLKYYCYITEDSAAPAKLSYHKTPLTLATKNNGALEENNGGVGSVVSKSKILVSKSKIQGQFHYDNVWFWFLKCWEKVSIETLPIIWRRHNTFSFTFLTFQLGGLGVGKKG